MSNAPDQHLLEALLDSWDRNNAIMLNLLRAVPEGGLEVKAIESSPSVAQQFTHIHHERLVSVLEEAPEFARTVPEEEWMVERDRDRIAQMLTDSAKAVRDAVRGRVLAGRDMDLNYDHPILMLQLMLWHEGYHHGQIKLALKVAGHPISDEEAGPFTWDVWRGKTGQTDSCQRPWHISNDRRRSVAEPAWSANSWQLLGSNLSRLTRPASAGLLDGESLRDAEIMSRTTRCERSVRRHRFGAANKLSQGLGSTAPFLLPTFQEQALALAGKEQIMLYYALVFLVVGLIASVLGASGVAAVASQIAWVLFVIGIILLIVHIITGRRTLVP